MLQETKLTINEDLFLRIIVKLEMYQMTRKAQGYNYENNDYDKEIQGLKEEVEKIWYGMETNKDYRLFEEL